MAELEVSTTEELDLLAKWLGPNSTKHVQSLRATNVQDPARGLQRTWERLDGSGSPEMVELALKSKQLNFPKLSNKDNKRLYDLSDILSEIESVKEQEIYRSLLAYFDSSSGINPVVNKLPYGLQEKWTTHAVKYKRQHGVSFPPFHVFVEFVREASKVRNDPSFVYDIHAQASPKKEKTNPLRVLVSNKKTEVMQQPKPQSKVDADPDSKCPIHKTSHLLKDCKTFRSKSYEERRQLLKKYRICFRCCATTTHQARECKATIKCDDCGSTRHISALHSDTWETDKPPPRQVVQDNGGEEKDSKVSQETPVSSKCTQVCGEAFGGKSCAKTVLVNVYRSGHPEKAIKTYAIIDDQSNTSLAKSDFFQLMNIHGDVISYTLSSCSGQTKTSGRKAKGYVVESLDRSVRLELPTLIECQQIPNFREEIPTPDVAQHHAHLADIVDQIPPLDEHADILLLIGRDITDAHHVHDQRIGPPRSPYAQKLSLGWVIIGEVCLGKVHQPNSVNVNKTHLLGDGRTSIFRPCPNMFSVKETYDQCEDTFIETYKSEDESLGSTVFVRTEHDDKQGMSIEDKEFLQIMDTETGFHLCRSAHPGHA